jgi:cyclase
MVAKRIIPCLDIKNGRTVKGIKFEGIIDVGCPIELAQRYEKEGADELVFLDISAHSECRPLLYPLVSRLAESLSIPFVVGGGIRTIDDAQQILDAGADKVAVNSAALLNSRLISSIAGRFGAQSLCLSVDSRKVEGKDLVFRNGGGEATGQSTLEWLKIGCSEGAGEILLTCIDSDGTKAGYNIALLQAAQEIITVPLIASGGAGKKEDFTRLFRETRAQGALAAGIFHSEKYSIEEVKRDLAEENIEVRMDWRTCYV